MKKTTEFSFETAYARLEQILNELNSGNQSLENSLVLYEEADTLIKLCSSKLNNAEQKIETLIKNRKGNLDLNELGCPETTPFIHNSEQGI